MINVKCGPITLELAGFMRFPDSLIFSIVHQFQRKTHLYTTPPIAALEHMRTLLHQHFISNFVDFSSPPSIIKSISNCLRVPIYLYEHNERKFFLPQFLENAVTITLELYVFNGRYDSINRMTEELFLNSPLPTSTGSFSFAFASWNIRGARSIEEQTMIDYHLHSKSYDVVILQETHLNGSTLLTPHFYWTLGPQYQERSSRGLGFLIRETMRPYVHEIIFVTANIAYVTLRFPYVERKLHIINVHKHSNNSPMSVIETGNFN